MARGINSTHGSQIIVTTAVTDVKEMIQSFPKLIRKYWPTSEDLSDQLIRVFSHLFCRLLPRPGTSVCMKSSIRLDSPIDSSSRHHSPDAYVSKRVRTAVASCIREKGFAINPPRPNGTPCLWIKSAP